MIGIRFQIPNEYNNFLLKIFSHVDVMQYEWDIITDSSLEKDILTNKMKTSSGIFTSNKLTGEMFLKCISKNNYYMIFVDIKAFSKTGRHSCIFSFADFVNSDCQLIFLCTDSQFVTVFCKDMGVLKQISDNCLQFGFQNINFIRYQDGNQFEVIAF